MSEVSAREAAQFLRRRDAEKRGARKELLLRAREDFDRIVRVLVDKYAPRRIYQWGSLLKEENVCEISDIDPAVEAAGSADRLFAVARDAEAPASFSPHMVE